MMKNTNSIVITLFRLQSLQLQKNNISEETYILELEKLKTSATNSYVDTAISSNQNNTINRLVHPDD